ncbi:hypothetical protein [Flavobacterium limi]|uniref:ParB-like nuclease domain-containing protein n=1 Tax=Flavobacterium limi TaxID=2045105 RepID=A0ABQ1U5C4_9FLAO|nr:hypothetical protein [Flavobacterium limi]GGF11179.1 hypothetical protein GCM10011518_20460 [Flavobacterium limi]
MNEIINITNGQNIIDVICDDFVGCLKIEKPVAYDKYELDSEQDSYKFFWLDADHKKIDELYNFKEVLIFGTDKEVETEIYSFLNIFSSARYEVLTQSLNLMNFDIHKNYFNVKDSKIYRYGYNSRFSLGPFNRDPCNIMFTMPLQNISHERVIFYKDLINKGIRPKIITTGYEDVVFILDGHHKLLAYQLSNIPAEIIFITRLDDNSDEEWLDLFLDYQFILSNEERDWIFENQKIGLLTDKTEKSLKYYTVLNTYLKEFEGHISTEVFNLILEALQSDKEEEKLWGNKKIHILRERNFKDKRIFLFINEVVGSVKINSKEEFDSLVEERLNNLDSNF